MKRIHYSEINFAGPDLEDYVLKPGLYRICMSEGELDLDPYVGSFEVREDGTVSFYGFKLRIRDAEGNDL